MDIGSLAALLKLLTEHFGEWLPIVLFFEAPLMITIYFLYKQTEYLKKSVEAKSVVNTALHAKLESILDITFKEFRRLSRTGRNHSNDVDDDIM